MMVKKTTFKFCQHLSLKLSVCLFIIGALHFTKAWGEVGADPSLGTLKGLSLEELMEVPLVYGASKYEQKVTDAPSSVSIVTADQIKKFGYRTLADILLSVRGFYINYDRNYGFLGVRGFNRPGDFGGRTLILIDGHRLNDPIFSNASIVEDFILDIDLIDRVEVIRGPGSSIYGNNAFFGVINIITRSGQDMNGPELAGRYASFDTYQGRATYGKRFENGLELLLSGTGFDSAGQERLFFKEFNKPENNNGIAEHRDGDSAYRLFGSLKYDDFTLQSAFISRDKDVPTAPFGTVFNDPRTSTLDERYYLDLSYAHQFANELDVKARIYYDAYHYNGDYPLPFGFGQTVLDKDQANAQWLGTELQLGKRLFNDHYIVGGFEYRNDFLLSRENFILEPRTVFQDTKDHTEAYSFFLQDEYSILSNLIVNAGFRYDYFSFFGDTINPRLGLIYKPWEETILKALYGEAFRAPNHHERTIIAPGFKTNPDLRPETIRTYELIWEQYLPDNMRFSVGGFYNSINGLISQQLDPADGLISFVNIDKVETKGADFEFECKTDSGWLGRISYTWQNTKNVSTGKTLTNSPEHSVKFNLIAPLYKDKLYGSLELQYFSNVKTLQANTIDSYWLTNVHLFSQRLLPGLDLSAGIFNLFDQKYGFPGGPAHLQDVIEQDGRTFQVRLWYHF